MIFEIKKLAKDIVRVVSGKTVHWETSDRSGDDASRGLTPAAVDRIMLLANSGDAAELFRLAAELPEKNWDIFHALQTRHNAVLGCPWKLEPGDDSPAAKAAAEKLQAELLSCGSADELDTFYDLMSDMVRGLLPGVAASEIIWAPGGSIAGFNFIEAKHLTLRDSRRPRLITRDNSNGVELQRGKFIVHLLRAHGPDPVRGGLIRPLAWLHCFANLNVKDLLRFVERYGMPFAVARVDENSWKNELAKLQNLVRNFGPNGGGVFNRSTEFQLLQAANNTGDVYFKLLEYVGAAITKVVLGQTATAGDGGGWSNDGAQSQVRQDILEADCRWIENTINVQLCETWNKYNSADGVPAPRLAIDSAQPEDRKIFAEVIKTLYEAGLETDVKEMSERFGVTLTRRAPALPPTSDQSDKSDKSAVPTALEALEAPLSPGTPSSPRAEGAAHRRPSYGPPALPASDPSDPSDLSDPSQKLIASGAVRRWLDPLQTQINAACDASDAQAAQAIADLAADPEAFFSAFDSSDLRAALETNTFEAYAAAKSGAPSSPRASVPPSDPSDKSDPSLSRAGGAVQTPSVVRTGGTP